MLLPPLLLGVLQFTVAVVLLTATVAVPIVGTPGVVYGVIELVAVDSSLDPAALIAETLKV